MGSTQVQPSKLGEGTYGAVFSVTTPHGIKAQKWNVVEQDVFGLSSCREIDILHRYKHPNIVDLEYCSTDVDPPIGSKHNSRKLKGERISLVFPLAEGHSGKMISRDSRKDTLLNAMADVLLGMEFLHSNRVTHRDLKPQNILVFMEGGRKVCKIADMGMTGQSYTQTESQYGIMTSWYRAPEICLSTPYTEKIDCWSIGCVFWEWITGEPFNQQSGSDSDILAKMVGSCIDIEFTSQTDMMNFVRKKTKNEVILRKIQMSFDRRKAVTRWNEFSTACMTKFQSQKGLSLIQLVRSLLKFDQDQRISCSRALESPFFDDIRDRINRTRFNFPLSENIREMPIQTRQCQEREWICDIARAMFHSHKRHKWYTHRTMFFALDLMDRYLVEKAHETFDKNTIRVLFAMCWNIGVKYFDVFNGDFTIRHILSKKLLTKENLAKALEFEVELFARIPSFQGSIFRTNAYESFCYRNKRPPTMQEVYRMLCVYLNDTEINGKRPSEI